MRCIKRHQFEVSCFYIVCRHVGRGGAGGGKCPPDFGRSEGAAGQWRRAALLPAPQIFRLCCIPDQCYLLIQTQSDSEKKSITRRDGGRSQNQGGIEIFGKDRVVRQIPQVPPPRPFHSAGPENNVVNYLQVEHKIIQSKLASQSLGKYVYVYLPTCFSDLSKQS